MCVSVCLSVCVSLLAHGCGGNVRLYRGLLRPHFFFKKKASWHRAVGAMSDSIGAFSDSIVVAQRENGAKSALRRACRRFQFAR